MKSGCLGDMAVCLRSVQWLRNLGSCGTVLRCKYVGSGRSHTAERRRARTSLSDMRVEVGRRWLSLWEFAEALPCISFSESTLRCQLTPMVDDAPPIELARAVTLPVPGLGIAPLSDGALILD